MTLVMYSSATAGVKAAARTPLVLLFFRCWTAYRLCPALISASLLLLHTYTNQILACRMKCEIVQNIKSYTDSRCCDT
jgi:hypothetical protein